MNEGYDISLVIPCYNEEKNVSLFYKECSCIFNKNKLNVQYIFINDGSRDETFNEIRILASENKNIVGISFSRNFGKESAIYAGLKKSSGKYTCIIDADLQQNPKYVVEMYNYILNNTEYDPSFIEKYKPDKIFLIRVERHSYEGLNLKFVE